ncbi:non-structural maintenance of chromosomes element 4 homolog A-like isoform X3 [Agrilus planipennis]|uniref:Non-structural maintenance of chromosomes element 4 n=1 Tax=Agrilus planipennis TaxID=224129 RepID=A0A1W4X5S5_AGRPL|nr:non-structural maintenance of chromosomes element 4 homolog A-like isoform X3 [Agrilus planipennis]
MEVDSVPSTSNVKDAGAPSTSKRSPNTNHKESYRLLLNRVNDLQESEDKGIRAALELGSILEEVDILENENTTAGVRDADETMLDSMVLSSASDYLVKCVKAVDLQTLTYHPAEFSTKLMNRLKGDNDFEPEKLFKLLNVANNLIPQLPQLSFLHGTFDPNVMPEPKQKKIVQRQAPEKLEKKKLQQVKTIDKEEDNINETINVLESFLKREYEENRQTPIKYFNFVIDSESFERTIENMFYFSFLLRDGKASLEIDNDGIPVVAPKSKRDLDEFRKKGGVNTQMISSMDIEQWQKLATKEGIIQKRKNNNS